MYKLNRVVLDATRKSDAPINSALYYLKERFPKADCWQISMTGKKYFLSPEGIRVCPALPFLEGLV